jgi:hypothetical protein
MSLLKARQLAHRAFNTAVEIDTAHAGRLEIIAAEHASGNDPAQAPSIMLRTLR